MTVNSTAVSRFDPPQGTVGELVNHLCDQHAAALLVLARVLFDRRADADAAVVRCLAEACTDSINGGQFSHREMRRRMAERVHTRWRLRAHVSPPAAVAPPEQVARLILELCRSGGHNYRQAADLVGIPLGGRSA